jgi:tetratricopeptide (TPR) repeat protein
VTCIKRGDAYRSKGEYDRALADYGNAIRLDPLNAAGYLNRAATYRLRGQNDLALVDLTQATRLDGNDARIWFERAITYRTLNLLSSALMDFDRALQLSPSDPELIYQRGCTYQLNGDLDNALADFDAVVSLKPNNALVHHSRGTLHISRGDLEEGIVDFGNALHCDPDFSQAYLSRASAWSKQGRFDQTIADCDEALRRDPTLTGANVLRASAHVQQGSYDEAIADFARVLAFDPDNAQVYHLRGLATMKQGRYDEALVDFNESLRLNPNNARTLFLRATVYQHREQHQEALNNFQQAVLLDPQYTAVYCNQRALVHALHGNYEQALADYAIVLQLDSTNVTALLGREQALQALQERASRPVEAPSQPPPTLPEKVGPENGASITTPSRPVKGRRKKRRKTDPHLPVPTEGIRKAKDTDVFPVFTDSTAEKEPAADTMDAPAEAPVLDAEMIEELAAESLIDRPIEAPAPAGPTAPDHAIQLPTGDISLEPGQPANGTGDARPVGPLEARTERERKDEQTSERAKMWAEMRYRERQKQVHAEELAEEREWVSTRSRRMVRRTMVVTLAVLFLGAVGLGVYALFFSGRDVKISADDVWREYAQNTNAANKKYKGEWVQVKGTLRIYKTEKVTQFFFKSPDEDAKWGILFDLSKAPDKDSLKNNDGQEITIRGRFTSRKEPGNLTMSNCTLIKEK